MNDLTLAKPPQTPAPSSTSTPRVRSEDLFAGGRLVVIVHAGREYRLRITAGNKLILTA